MRSSRSTVVPIGTSPNERLPSKKMTRDSTGADGDVGVPPPPPPHAEITETHDHNPASIHRVLSSHETGLTKCQPLQARHLSKEVRRSCYVIERRNNRA